MASELYKPISISESGDDKNFKRVIDDNFVNLARHLNDILGWVSDDKIAIGSIKADKYYELRNTYVFSDQDSLDASYPFEMDFEIVSEMTAIESVKLSFRIREFRAYATTVPSGGGDTSGSQGAASGGGSTSGAQGSASGGGHTTPSGGGATSEATAPSHTHPVYATSITPTSTVSGHAHDYDKADVTSGSTAPSHTHEVSNHTHTVSDHTHPNHTHTTPAHTHPGHTHTTPAHTHSLTFGIYEDSQSPTLHYHIDNGSGYGGASGNLTTDQLDINITSSISAVGFKRIKFDSDVRCRISAWVLCKVDLTA